LKRNKIIFLKTEAVFSSQTPVDIYQTTRSNIPEGRNLKFDNIMRMFVKGLGYESVKFRIADYTASHSPLLLLDEIMWKGGKALGSEDGKSMRGTWNMKRRAKEGKSEMGSRDISRSGGIAPPFLTSMLDGGQ
jgi:hypothetical protein